MSNERPQLGNAPPNPIPVIAGVLDAQGDVMYQDHLPPACPWLDAETIEPKDFKLTDTRGITMDKQKEEALRIENATIQAILNEEFAVNNRGSMTGSSGQDIAPPIAEPKAQRLSSAINRVDGLDRRLSNLMCDLTDGLTDEANINEAKTDSPRYSVADLMANGADILTEKIICCEKKVEHLRKILL